MPLTVPVRVDEMRAQGHKLKNLIGLLGDRVKRMQGAGELARDVDELYGNMKSYLDAMREEPLELDLYRRLLKRIGASKPFSFRWRRAPNGQALAAMPAYRTLPGQPP